MAEAAEVRRVSERGDGWRAFAIFCGVALTVAALYLASAALFADLRVFLEPGGRFAIARIARFNGALVLVLAYECAALWLGRRWVLGGFDELRRAVDASDAEWAAWAERLRVLELGGMARAAALGIVGGLLVDVIGDRESPADTGAWTVLWRGHVVWVWILNPLVFGAMGLLIWFNRRGARLYQELGRRTRVRLGDLTDLSPFARMGLRLALLWFVGTSLASLLLVDTDSPVLVVSILVLTTVIAAASLLAPSSGVHERLQEAKREELAWVRSEIARSSSALRRGDTAGAAQLPALLAWEARVADAPEWPFDSGTVVRFGLFLLVPLASWLGGAFAERVVERWFGA